MRILYVCINKLITRPSAPRVHVLSLTDELAKLGHQVLLLHPKGEKFEDNKRNKNIRKLPLPHIFFNDKFLLNRIMVNLIYLFIVVLFQPDFVYERETGYSSIVAISNFLKIPRLIELNGWTEIKGDYYKQKEKTITGQYRKNFKGAVGVIVRAPGVGDKVRKHLNIASNKIFYIPNGVDIEKFTPPPINLLSSQRKIVVGYVGGFTSNQDVNTIINAIEILRNNGELLELRMIGDYGSIYKDLIKKIDSSNLTNIVKLIGPLPHSHIPEQLWGMDICVAAYKKEFIETFGRLEGAMKIWEYWASQKPVIATDVKDSSFFASPEKLYLAVEPENPVAMANAIKFLINHPNIRRDIGRIGYEYVKKHYSWIKVAKETESVMIRIKKN